jgi:hypothetical protein
MELARARQTLRIAQSAARIRSGRVSVAADP